MSHIHIPAILRILIVFITVLWAIKKKVSLGSSFLFGSVLLGLISGMGFFPILKSIFFSLIHPKTMSLAIVVSLILVLSHSMEAVGQMERLLNSFQGFIKNPGINLIIFPALIGLLPMPGGAIFSAPMVKTIGKKRNLTGAQLSFINYWFRHIWEYWWPLYPGVLLVTTMADFNLWNFVLFLFPLTIVAIISGYWPLRKMIKNIPSGQKDNNPPFGPFFMELLPILIVIVVGICAGVVLSYFLKPRGIAVSKELGLIFALMIAIGLVWHKNKFPVKDRIKILRQPELLQMFYMVASILVFQGVLKDSRSVYDLSRELMAWKIPLVPITMLLPFLVGGAAGITIAFVGTTFPILISIITAYGEAHLMLPYMMLAMVSGFSGVLLSPLHLCLLLSNGYFKTSLQPVYRYLWAPCFFLVLSGSLYFFGAHNIWNAH